VDAGASLACLRRRHPGRAFALVLLQRRNPARCQRPGKYSGKIVIKAKEAKTELPLEVEVLPVDLLTMDEAG